MYKGATLLFEFFQAQNLVDIDHFLYLLKIWFKIINCMIWLQKFELKTSDLFSIYSDPFSIPNSVFAIRFFYEKFL